LTGRLTFILDCVINIVFQERHWTSPGMATALQAAINTPQSNRLKQILKLTPRILDVYFAITLRDVNNCMLLQFECSFDIGTFFFF
jgi:hypothetical protein